ncbi:PREDICTED: uncharacterized protein LOC109228049 [Nicotiana attenuata]|uniref:uncharacterized protein LOC109228049 n=1 Tax=Nicotiana attenuata TaxID=49451 RepID=UPI000905350F|nr:PREDICTED: uncharacterized protein LOC109228049 [Nicotiana attenuata]
MAGDGRFRYWKCRKDPARTSPPTDNSDLRGVVRRPVEVREELGGWYKMIKVDLLFNHGGDWIREPHLLYSKKLVHTWPGYDLDLLSFIDIVNEYTTELGFVGIQQLIVTAPSGKYYKIEGDDGIRKLYSLVSEEYRIINIYAVDECEPSVEVPNIVQHTKSFFSVVNEVGTDCSENESESDCEAGSDCPEYDSEELESIATQKKRKITVGLEGYKELFKDMSFKGIPEARKCIKLYCLANKVELEVVKSDKHRLRYECIPGCPFVCHISEEKGSPRVKIKTLNPKHECGPSYDNSRVDHTTIAHYFKKKLQDNPKFKVKEMRTDLKEAFELNASKGKCKRAKRMVLEILEGSFTDGYKKLEAYANELRDSNPGSDVVINLSKEALAKGKRKFLRMYIFFKAMKMGFKEGLRPFIGLDGTFLKGKAKGQLLVAVGQDNMNHFYPLSWAIVDKETKRTWNWFLGLLHNSLELQIGEGITFMSDMQKFLFLLSAGLIDAINIVLPEAHHRFCVRHIESNWCKRWSKGGGELEKLLWWSAWSSYEEEFQDQLNHMGQLDEPAILEERYKPIIGMLEDIRIKVMNQLREHEDSVTKWSGEFSPKTMKLYNEYMKIAQVCRVDSNGDNGFEVSEGSDKHIVNLRIKRCTYRAWDLTGIPYPHAIKALLYKRIDSLTKMHWFHSKEACLLTCKHKSQPVRGEKFWKVDPSQAMEPPELVKLAGRP